MRLNHRYIVPDFYTGIKKQTTNDRFLTVLGSLYAGSPQINKVTQTNILTLIHVDPATMQREEVLEPAA